MAVTVVNQDTLTEFVTTGIAPPIAEVVADNEGKSIEQPKDDAAVSSGVAPDEAGNTQDRGASANDDIEGDDGLTPRQKREFTDQMQKTIAKKHRQRMEAEEFAAIQYNEKRLEVDRANRLEQELAALKAKDAPKVEAPKEPKREDFQSDIEYWKAQTRWEVQLELQTQAKKDQEAKEQARQAQILETARAKIIAAAEIVPDWREVVGAVDWPTPPAVAGYMQESDLFAELGYHLAKHPEVREKLDSLTPSKQLVEIGKIESTLQPFVKSDSADTKAGNGKPSNTESKPNGTVTPSTDTGTSPSKPRVAPVITPLNTSSAGQVDKPPHERTYAEERAAWAKKHRVNLDRRKRH